jgi:simple sugar transport system substrate-binding protein
VVAILVVGVWSSIGSGASRAKPKIAFVCATTSIPFFGPVVNGVKDAARQLGIKVNYTGMDAAHISGPAEATILKAALVQKPDALIVCNFFPSSQDPYIKQAVASGIPVWVTNSGSSTYQAVGALAYFGEESTMAGASAANAMVKAGVKHGLCFDDTPGNPDVAARCTGFQKQMKASGKKVTVVNDQQASTNPSAILAAIKGQLASNPSIDGVLTLGPGQGEAALQAVDQSGKKGKVKVGTFDLSTNTLAAVNDGSLLFAVWQEPYLQGYLPVLSAYQYLTLGQTPVGWVNTGPLLVTKANVGKVTAAVKLGRG